MENKLSREITEKELTRKYGADILYKKLYYHISGHTLEEAEKKFPGFKLFYEGKYWKIERKNI